MDPARLAAPGEVIDPADIEVLMVHRPRYHDWSWPKGKAEHGEPLVAAAVREVEEETGQVVTLGAPLTTQRYRLGGGQTKEVHYWVGTPVSGGPAAFVRAPVARAPRTEIDRAEWVAPERAAEMLTRRGDRRLLADLLARAREGRLATATLVVLHPGDGDGSGPGEALPAPSAPRARVAAGDSPADTDVSPSLRPAPTPALVASAAARRAAQVERFSSRPREEAAPLVDPPLGRYGVRQAFDLVDLLSAFGVTRGYASPLARARQFLAPWACAGGASVTLVESLGPGAASGAEEGEQTRLALARAFAAQRLRERGTPTVVSVTGSAREALIEEIRAHAPGAVAAAGSPPAASGQILVAHVEYGDEGPVVAAIETHGVTTKNPAAHPRQGNKRH